MTNGTNFYFNLPTTLRYPHTMQGCVVFLELAQLPGAHCCGTAGLPAEVIERRREYPQQISLSTEAARFTPEQGLRNRGKWSGEHLYVKDGDRKGICTFWGFKTKRRKWDLRRNVTNGMIAYTFEEWLMQPKEFI